MLLLIQLFIVITYSTCSLHNQVLPQPIETHQIAYYDVTKTIYLFGGLNSTGKATDAIYKWDMNQNSWFQTMTITTPTKRFQSYGANVVTIDNIAYFIGIHDGAYNSGKIYMFDMLNEIWLDNSNLAIPSDPASYGCLTTDSQTIFMIGGWNADWVETDVLQIYDIVSNQWNIETINISPIQNAGWNAQYCALINNTIFAFGGMISSNSISGMYKYNINKHQWTHFNDLPVISRDGATVYNQYTGYMYAIGGWEKNNDSIWIFDTQTQQLTDTMHLVNGRCCSAAIIINNDLWVFGGQYGGVLDTVEICDLYPTNSPTHVPSISPSKFPTKYPSKIPTISPIKFPTKFPSKMPTISPTNLPTITPVKFSTKIPTNYATKIPAVAPIDSAEVYDTTAHYPTNAHYINKSSTDHIILIGIIIVSVIICLLCVIFILMIYMRRKGIRVSSVSVQLQSINHSKNSSINTNTKTTLTSSGEGIPKVQLNQIVAVSSHSNPESHKSNKTTLGAINDQSSDSEDSILYDQTQSNILQDSNTGGEKTSRTPITPKSPGYTPDSPGGAI
eukprot:245529_1